MQYGITAMFKSKKNKQSDDYWIALSDVMTALMLLFLLISVVYMIKVNDSVKIPKIFKQTTQGLSDKLNNEFDKDLHAWGAVIDKDLTIRFLQPDILFKVGSSNVSNEFKMILDDFFPRYLNILMSDEFIDNIEEIRIEGHTSSAWENATEKNEAYLKNMALSQERTRAVLEYIINSNKLNENQINWLKTHFRVIGFSSARLLDKNQQPVTNNSTEDPLKSQRVEFRVRTNIEQKVSSIIKK